MPVLRCAREETASPARSAPKEAPLRKRVLVLATLLLAACVTQPASQPFATVFATDNDLQPFAGLWRGHLDSSDERMAGDVEFRFQKGGTLLLAGRTPPSRILWVRVNAHALAGALEPYFDPARGANVYSTFEGTLGGDGVLRGVLRERIGMQWRDAGTWTALRVSD